MTEKEILEQTYLDTCNIYELTQDKTSSITRKAWTLVHANVKCSLSRNKLNNTFQTEPANRINQSYTLFIDPGIEIKAGSKLTCNGLELICGKSFKYPESHQEVPLLLEDRA